MYLDNNNNWFFPEAKPNEMNLITEKQIDRLISMAYEEDVHCDDARDQVNSMPSSVENQRYAMFNQMERSLRIRGNLCKTIYGKTIITFDSRRHFYRGECQIFQHSLPSLNRKLRGLEEKQQELYRAVANLQINQFRKFIQTINIIKSWEHTILDINYKALAQHYGFDTHLLDLTNDFRAALFFATCKYNSDTDDYSPLTKEDIETSDKHKYGVVFHSPLGAIDFMDIRARALWEFKHQYDGIKSYSLDSGDFDGMAFQIGYQPFMRCHCQSGYIFPMKNSMPLQEDKRFEKLWFHQSPELSKRIFDMMEGGDKVFPDEGISKAKSTLALIRKSTVFSENDLAYVYENEGVNKDMFQCLGCFQDALDGMDYGGRSIEIQDKEVEYKISDDLRKAMNSQYDQIDYIDVLGGEMRIALTI